MWIHYVICIEWLLLDPCIAQNDFNLCIQRMVPSCFFCTCLFCSVCWPLRTDTCNQVVPPFPWKAHALVRHHDDQCICCCCLHPSGFPSAIRNNANTEHMVDLGVCVIGATKSTALFHALRTLFYVFGFAYRFIYACFSVLLLPFFGFCFWTTHVISSKCCIVYCNRQQRTTNTNSMIAQQRRAVFLFLFLLMNDFLVCHKS